MRTLVLLLLLPFVLYSQEDKEMENDSYFIALYTLGETWDTEKQPQDQVYFKEHSAFLQQLRNAEQITVGARYAATGMLILRAKDLATVKDLLHSDVAVQNQLFNVEVQAFSPFYKGCIE